MIKSERDERFQENMQRCSTPTVVAGANRQPSPAEVSGELWL